MKMQWFRNLSRRRKIMFGVSALLLVSGFVVRYVIEPNMPHLSTDFSYKADIYSLDNFYDSGEKRFSGAQPSKTFYSYEAIARRGEVIEIKNTFDVSSFTGKPIISLERIYGIDQKTLTHVPGYGDRDRDGYLFAPHGLKEGQGFRYWHINYDVPVDLKYAAKEDINGLSVYRYHADLTADQTKDLAHLPEVPEKYGVNLDASLYVWVEPQTGHLVKYEDHSTAYFYDPATGQRVMPWNQFNNKFTESSIANQVESARQHILKDNLLTVVLPVMLVVIGLFLALESLLVIPHFKLVLILVPVTILSVSLALFFNAITSQQQASREAFVNRAEAVVKAFEKRLIDYSVTLQGGKGLFAANESVSREQWRAYTNTLNVASKLPGVQGLGYSEKIGDSSQLEEHIEQIRAEGFPNYSVHPAGERSEYHSIVYLEPFDERNQRAFGYDMFQEPTRRIAMLRARDSGEMSISRKITLRQETGVDQQNGFLMYVPVYHNDLPSVTIEERRAALAGFVYSPFRSGDLFRSVVSQMGEDIKFEVYDRSIADKNLLYRSAAADLPPGSPTLSMQLGGTLWHIRFAQAQPSLLVGKEYQTAWARLAIGVAITALVTTILLSYRRTNMQALRLAKSMTENLNSEKEHAQAIAAKDEAILAGIGEGLIAFDSDGKVERLNSTAQNLLGYSENQLLGKDYAKVIKARNENGRVISYRERPSYKALRSKKVTSTTLYYSRADGSTFPAQITIAPTILEGKVIGAIEVFRDITKEKSVNKAKTEFVSLASHQLRTPLSTINWYAEMLLNGDAGKITEEQTKYVQEIYAGNQHMTELVNSLLNVSRIDIGTFTVEPEPTDIRALIQEIIKGLEPRVFERKIGFDEQYDDNLPLVNVDPKLMRMVIENLTSNAIKYTPVGGSVTLVVRLSDEHLLISVQDTGYGIPTHQQNKIFSKLFRADNIKVQDTEGTGLGLYIVKSIVDYSGGKIWFTSVENKGTTFYVSIPLEGMKEKHGAKRLD